MKYYKLIGQKGRTTIPYYMRVRIGIRDKDVISFEEQYDGSIVLRKEDICDVCDFIKDECAEKFTLEDFLDSLSEEEQRDALVHLSLLWAEKKK